MMELGLMTYGYPGMERFVYGEILEQRYGVATLPIAGCVVNDAITHRADGYNAVMIPEIEHRFGVGVLDRIWQEAAEKVEERCGPGTLCL